MYSLWLDSFRKVQKYELNKIKEEEKIDCKKLKFRVDGVLKDDFTLEEVDSLTAGYESFEDLGKKLTSLEYRDNYLYKAKNKLIATYRDSNNIRQLELVYNSKLLLRYALLNRYKYNKEGVLEELEGIDQLVDKLLEMTKNDNLRLYIYQSSKEFNELKKEYKNKLKKYLPEEKKIRKRNLKRELELYIQYYDSLEKIKNKIIDRDLDLEKNLLHNLQRSRNDIKREILRNYETLRRTILFVQLVEEIEKNKEQEKIEEDNQLELFDTQKEIEEYKRIYEENADIMKEIAEERRKKYEEYEEKPKKYIKIGGNDG